MLGQKPTEAQIKFLRNRHVVPPPYRAACRLLIGYLKQGNGTIGDSEGARIALTISYQRKWLGKKVQTAVSFAKGTEGVVRYLGARSADDVMILYRDSGSTKLHPFKGNVVFSNGKSQMLALSNLQLIPASEGLNIGEGENMKLTGDVFSKRSYREGEDGVRNRREVGACVLAAEKLGIRVEYGWGLHAMYIDPEKLTLQERRLIVRRAKSISEEEVRQFWEELGNEMFPERD